MSTNARRLPTSVAPMPIAKIQTDLTSAIVRLVTPATVKIAPELVRNSSSIRITATERFPVH